MSHSKVDEGYTTADVRQELNRGIPSKQEHCEWGKDNILTPETDENMATSPADLLVLHSIEDWIEMLHILNL